MRPHLRIARPVSDLSRSGSMYTSLIEPTTYVKYGYVFFDHAFEWIRDAAPDDPLLTDISAAGDVSLMRWDGSSVAPLASSAGVQLLPGADGSVALATAAAPERLSVEGLHLGAMARPRDS